MGEALEYWQQSTTSGSPSLVKPVEPEEIIIFPENTRYYRKEKKSRHSFLVEVRPRITEFKYHDDDHRYVRYGAKKLITRTYKVATPWQYFWVHVAKSPENMYGISYSFEGVHIFWALDQMQDLNSIVFPAMLPNLCQAPNQFYHEYGVGVLCPGTARPERIKSFDDAAKQIIVNTYASKFNPNMRNGTPIPFGDPKIWADQSKVKFGWMDWPEFTHNENTMPLHQALIPTHGKEW